MVDFTIILENANNWLVTMGPKIIIALITLFVGWKLIGFFVRILEKIWTKRKMDASLRHFLERLISVTLKILLLITIVANLGVQTTSFVALIGAAGLAVGLALQGSLANFAGGVLILMFKPFVIGDYIKAQGEEGIVKHIDIINTTMLTLDNKTIIIPNGNLSNNTIINYTKEALRRVDITIGISYDDDIKKAEKILMDIINKHKLTLKNPEPFVRVSELGDNSVNFALRAWCKTENYWDVYFDIMELVKITFDEQGVSFPYPQMDVHLHKQ